MLDSSSASLPSSGDRQDVRDTPAQPASSSRDNPYIQTFTPEVHNLPQPIYRELQHIGHGYGVCCTLRSNKAAVRAILDLVILQVPSASDSSAHTTCSDAGNPSDWCPVRASPECIAFHGGYFQRSGAISPAMLLIFCGTGNFSGVPLLIYIVLQEFKASLKK